MSDLSLFRRNRIDHRVSAHSASYSKLGPRLFAMNGSKKKKFTPVSQGLRILIRLMRVNL